MASCAAASRALPVKVARIFSMKARSASSSRSASVRFCWANFPKRSASVSSTSVKSAAISSITALSLRFCPAAP